MSALQTPIKIGLFGMDQRSCKLIKMTLAQKVSLLCEIVDSSSAEVALLDMDGANHQSELDLLRQSDLKIPIIAISIKQMATEGLYFLRKPLSLPSLLGLLREIFADKYIQKASGDGISTTNISQNNATAIKKNNVGIVANVLDKRGQSSRIGTASYAASDDMFFDPELYTLSYVQEAIVKSRKIDKQVALKLWDGKTILIDTKYNKILTDVSIGHMRAFGVVIVDQNNTTIKLKPADPATEFDFNPKYNSSIRVTSIDEFLWQLAVITARGRLPNTLTNDIAFDLQSPVYINEWPNFTRMTPIPHAIRVVAFWMRQPIALGKLSSLLDVDEESINGLFYACHSIGIAGQGTRQVDNIIEPIFPDHHKNRNIFAALLGHLKRRG